MAYRLRLVGAVAVALITSAVFVQGQSVASSSASVLPQGINYESSFAYQNGGSASHYVYAPTPKAQADGQQKSDSSQGQTQSGNQGQGMNSSQNQTQAQNQNQVENGKGKNKEEAAPKKPTYLTYSTQKKSLEEQAKSGKTLSVDFKSVPAGASITIDGYFVGRTPTTKQIPVGKHLVSITKWGYQTWSQELDFSSGKNLNVNPSLHKDW